MPSNVETVCVTGATGFIASHIVRELLERGYTVHGTVRDPFDQDKVGFLKAMARPSKLKLFRANLLEQGSFDEAVKACDAVIHTASPVVNNAPDPKRQLVDPAVKGTLNVLRSSAHCGSVRRFIYLSSCSTVDKGGGKRLSKVNFAHPFNETHWNTVSSLETNPYAYGKTQAERLAFQFVEGLPEHQKFRLISTLPAVVVGPLLTKRLPMSAKSVGILLSGNYGPFCPPMFAPYVDVRDVARAHCFLLEKEEAREDDT